MEELKNLDQVQQIFVSALKRFLLVPLFYSRCDILGFHRDEVSYCGPLRCDTTSLH